jgi:hypothetical protein
MYRFSFFNSALLGDEKSASRPGRFTLRYALYRRLGGPERRLWQRGEKNILDSTDTRPLILSSYSPQTMIFFIYNLNQQSEFTFYKLMLWLLQCLDGESSNEIALNFGINFVVRKPNKVWRIGGNRGDWNNSVYETATVCDSAGVYVQYSW